MKLLIAVVLAVSIGFGAASCPDGCSGHGFCGAFDLCSCYPNWSGIDCSGRVCPSTKAWVDTAIASEDAHNYATCGNKGDCDGKSGECDCYEPFSGKGCRRMSCPDDCSGHGTCEYMEELAMNNKCAWNSENQSTDTNCVHSSIVSSPTYSAASITYTAWDAQKIQGCQCDPGWSGINCGGRICPVGNDPLRTRNADESAVQVHPEFTIKVGTSGQRTAWITAETASAAANGDKKGKGPPSIVLAFTDTYNEKWYTRPIVLAAKADGYQVNLAHADTKTALATRVYNALLDLPNAAITGASIDPVTGVATSSKLEVSVITRTHASLVDNNAVDIKIKFKSPHNSGTLLNKLECHHTGCITLGSTTAANPGGCAPMYSGLVAGPTGTGGGADTTTACEVHVSVTGTTNQDTCSSRGSCDGGSGLCQCLEGYTDEDCSMQTVLV